MDTQWTVSKCHEYGDTLLDELHGQPIPQAFRRVLDEVPVRQHGTVVAIMLASGKMRRFTRG